MDLLLLVRNYGQANHSIFTQDRDYLCMQHAILF